MFSLVLHYLHETDWHAHLFESYSQSDSFGDKMISALKVGAADAVIMWNGVAKTFADSLEIVDLPYEFNTEIRVHVIGLNYSKNNEAVIKFIDFARYRGPEIFAEFGYLK